MKKNHNNAAAFPGGFFIARRKMRDNGKEVICGARVMAVSLLLR